MERRQPRRRKAVVQLLDPGFVADGGISDAATARVRDTLLESGDIKTSAPPSTYVDLRFATAAAK